VEIRKIAAGLIAIMLFTCVGRNAGAQTPDQEQAAQDLKDADAVSQRHRAELMKIPHVRVVTGEVDGQNEAAILVEVDDPKNVDEVARQLPSKIEGFPVEVDEDVTDPKGEPGGDSRQIAPTPIPPLIDKNGYYHHSWLMPTAPATNPGAQP
jgi:hypothetical protein